MKSIYRENQEYFEELREYAIAYVQYVQNGGCICKWTDTMVDKTIDVVMKIKANRDWLLECDHKPIPVYDDQGERTMVS